MLEMAIEQGSAGYFWAVMRVEENGFFEPSGDRSLIYFDNYKACRASAVEWCAEIGIPIPASILPGLGSKFFGRKFQAVTNNWDHVDINVSPEGSLEVTYA